MSVPTRNDPIWGPVPLPDNIKEIRPQQWDVILEGVEAFRDGYDTLFIEAPTGAGKSFIGEGLRRVLRTNAVYTSTTKALQDQLARSFPYGKVIKGRNNYPTARGNVDEFGNPWDRPYSMITAADCTWNNVTSTCSWCPYSWACPYRQALREARNAELAILNTSYFLTDTRYAGHFRNRGLVILDEADTVEDEVLNQIEIELSARRLDVLGIKPPQYKTKPESWASWIYYDAGPAITQWLGAATKPWDEGATARDIKEYRSMEDLGDRLQYVKGEIAMGNWIYDSYDGEEANVRFAPILIDKFGETAIWPHGQKFVLTSATILSADLMADDLGLYLPYHTISVPSAFPVANRPIYVVPVTDMGFKAKEATNGATWVKMADAIVAVLNRHPDDRVLVHTVSYELSRFLQERLQRHPDLQRRPILTYSSSDGKKGALREYERHPASVMLAPSMDRGIDLPDDLCRVQIVAKIPFPNFKRDKRVAARMRKPAGDSWYRSKVIRTLIQMAGRGVRHENDFATTYILDKQFTDNLWKAEFLFPLWFKEAMVWSMTPYHLMRR